MFPLRHFVTIYGKKVRMMAGQKRGDPKVAYGVIRV